MQRISPALLDRLMVVRGAWSGEALPYSWYTRHLEQHHYRKRLAYGVLGCALWTLLRPRERPAPAAVSPSA